MTITQDRLKELLDYNPSTGVFRWKENTGSRGKKGAVTGCVRWDKHSFPEEPNDCKKYMIIGVDGKTHRAHRLAFLYVHGYMPKEVDHKDNHGLHNWIDNLREATHAQNNWNKKLKINNKSRYKGVCLDKRRGTWRAEIQANKVRYSGTGFDTPELAYSWYCQKAKELHGEFARV